MLALPIGYARNLTVDQAPIAAYVEPPPHFSYQRAVSEYAGRLVREARDPDMRVLDVGCPVHIFGGLPR